MKNLKVNDPVMWRKKEYKFVRYISATSLKTPMQYPDPTEKVLLAVIEAKGETNRQRLTVPLNELDLIMEFNFEL